jgi:DNA-binding NarL/FixJ family response regulator
MRSQVCCVLLQFLVEPQSRIAEWHVNNVVVVQDRIFQSLQFAGKLSVVAPEFVLVRCPGEAANVIAWCARFESCIVIVEGGELLGIAPGRFSELLRSCPFARVIALVNDVKCEACESLLLLGCSGLVQNSISVSSFKRAVFAIQSGEIAASRRVISRAFQTFLGRRISRREQNILDLLRGGLSNRQIAEQLFISQETLRWHLRNLYSKTGIRTRIHLQEYAARSFETAAASASLIGSQADNNEAPGEKMARATAQ